MRELRTHPAQQARLDVATIRLGAAFKLSQIIMKSFLRFQLRYWLALMAAAYLWATLKAAGVL